MNLLRRTIVPGLVTFVNDLIVPDSLLSSAESDLNLSSCCFLATSFCRSCL